MEIRTVPIERRMVPLGQNAHFNGRIYAVVVFRPPRTNIVRGAADRISSVTVDRYANLAPLVRVTAVEHSIKLLFHFPVGKQLQFRAEQNTVLAAALVELQNPNGTAWRFEERRNLARAGEETERTSTVISPQVIRCHRSGRS